MPTLVISELFAPRVGGTATWFLEVYRRYPRGEAVVMTHRQRGDEATDARLPFPVHRVAMTMDDWGFLRPRSALRYLGLTLCAWRLARRHRVTAVHCGRVMPEGVVGYLLRGLAGLPYCVYAHGEEIGTARASRQLSLLMRRAYGSAAAVIANSANTRRLLTDVGVTATKIAVIRPGVDSDRFRPGGEARLVREQLGLDSHPVLLTVARLQRRKGHDVVLRALPAVRAAVPDVRYLVVGGGEEEARLRALARTARVADIVTFAGQVADDRLPGYYSACDVFVLPNREEVHRDVEGFGIAFLEAGAAGKPAIAGMSGGAGEAVLHGETGLLVDGEDPAAVAGAIVSLLTDPSRARGMGARGRARVIESFAWDAISRQIQGLPPGETGR